MKRSASANSSWLESVQRNPAGVLAVVNGVATDVRGAVGGVVVVAVASGADLTVSVPVCSLAKATATAPMATTALALITANSNLTLLCWSTLTTPFGPGSSATLANRPFEGEGAQFIHLFLREGGEILRLLPLRGPETLAPRGPETSCVKYLTGQVGHCDFLWVVAVHAPVAHPEALINAFDK
jgi:hypothetical protein